MRAFIAVEISSQEILDAIKLIQTDLKIDAKPVRLQHMHFTLIFLGEVPDSILEQVKKSVETIRFSPFDVSFVGVGAFPKPASPRVVWIGTDELGGKSLKALAKKVEEKLSSIGFISDKPFKPHVTIFRFKKKADNISGCLSKYEKFEFGTQTINEIKLKKSVLTPDGPNYSDLKVVKATL